MAHLASKLRTIFSILLLCSYGATAQQELAGAKVAKDAAGNVMVSSGESRPLRFALLALAETYGWVIDYEDPVYSRGEITDTTDAQWLKEHPSGRHVHAPTPGLFSADLGRVQNGTPDEVGMVNKLVDLYDHTSNPGMFQVIRAGDGRLVVTGQSRFQGSDPFTPVLSQQMRPSQESQNAAKALQELVSQCGSSGTVPIESGIIPINALATSTVGGYAGNLSCRDQLARILAALDHPVEYLLLYDINTRAYYLNITPAHRLVTGPDGKLTAVPLDNRN